MTTSTSRTAEHLRAKIAEVDTAIAEAVETIPEEHRAIMVYHDAWSYFAEG